MYHAGQFCKLAAYFTELGGNRDDGADRQHTEADIGAEDPGRYRETCFDTGESSFEAGRLLARTRFDQRASERAGFALPFRDPLLRAGLVSSVTLLVFQGAGQQSCDRIGQGQRAGKQVGDGADDRQVSFRCAGEDRGGGGDRFDGGAIGGE